ncbi:MAG TPA: thioredoxin family protein [Candidatus Krumholzibacteria bacterium]|nr:thioredoxin family protein [Candidatus Krumholzibacteria bacterium]
MPEPQIDVAPFYNHGMSWAQFLETATANRGRLQSFYDAFDFDEETLTFFNGRTPLQVLAIAEDWCPDVAQNVAVIARIADEVPGMELSIVRREGNAGLMAEYATGGKERIPVIAFYDMTFRELARWAGRCRAADAWIFDEVLAGTRDIMSLAGDAGRAFNDEYDRRYRDTYAWESIKEWQHLLEDQDY